MMNIKLNIDQINLVKTLVGMAIDRHRLAMSFDESSSSRSFFLGVARGLKSAARMSATKFKRQNLQLELIWNP